MYTMSATASNPPCAQSKQPDASAPTPTCLYSRNWNIILHTSCVTNSIETTDWEQRLLACGLCVIDCKLDPTNSTASDDTHLLQHTGIHAEHLCKCEPGQHGTIMAKTQLGYPLIQGHASVVMITACGATLVTDRTHGLLLWRYLWARRRA